jgi:hypothetical protein
MTQIGSAFTATVLQRSIASNGGDQRTGPLCGNAVEVPF